MDAIIYYHKPKKVVNGTAFYAFEYFVFLKKYIPNLQFIFVGGELSNLKYLQEIFLDKYNFQNKILKDMLSLTPVEFMLANVKNALIFDVHSYKHMQDYLGRTENVLLYCNKPDGEKFFNQRNRDTFYGWYDYQSYHVKTRLKLYADIHKTYKEKGNKTFISSPNGDNIAVANTLGIDVDDVYIKEPNSHHEKLFEKINKIVYWHYGNNDANNRIIIESAIHNIPLEVYTNGTEGDSVYDRMNLVKEKQADECYLNINDVMVQDFINVCGE